MRCLRAFGLVTAIVSLAALLGGCGPGLIALAGGTGGGIFGFQSGGKDKDKGGGGGSSNTRPAVVINSLTREDAPATIAYTLIDAEQNLCSVNVTYSLDGVNFFGCTQGTGGDMTTGLNSSAGGTSHTFEWDYELDLLTEELVTGITIAITANDGFGDGQVASLANLVVGNDAPVLLTSTSPQSPAVLVNGGLVLVNFVLTDTSADIAGMAVLFTLDQGQTFTELTASDYVGTPPFTLLTTTTGASGQFIWNSSVALPGFVGNNVTLLLVPVDKPNGWVDYTMGTPVPVGPFALNNIANGPPEITLVSDINGTSHVGTVNVQFTLTDTGSDSAVVALEYSENGGPFTPARLVGQATPQDAGPFVCSPNPRLYSLTWDALADLGTTGVKSVELRLTPAQFGAPATVGAPVLTGSFFVDANEAPEVSDFQVYQNSGNITVRVRLMDSSSDAVSLDITARWNGGASSYVLTSADFAAGDITNCAASPAGEDNLLIWMTTRASSPLASINASDVFWEITPTDNPLSNPGAALSGSLYTSAIFPVINDINGALPVAINLSEDSGAVTVNLSQTRNFTALIQPTAALDHTVTWDIVEGASYGTIAPVSSPAQGPQTALYTAPAVIPSPGPGYATVRCTSNATATVFSTWRLYFGDAPTAVNVTPSNPFIVLGHNQQFSAAVTPAGAPQLVSWQVIGGSQFGSITNTGMYTAPSTMPGAGRLVTIRATSVNPTVFGESVVTLQPPPSFCTVTEAVGSSAGPSQVTLGNTLQLLATIDPPDAPQAVFWTIDWNSVDQGSGNPTVGTVSATGQYSAPSTLPSPSQVFVRARSQQFPSVTDTYQIDLIAPPPTSFQVTPATITLTAGGAGVDFNLINVVPSNANQSVTWTQNPVFGTLDAQTGVYTPPPNAATTTIVTIRATSNVAGSVFAQATVTVMPNAQVAPQTVVISPLSGRTFVQGRTLQFTASVLPAGASQSVTWSKISGNGSIDSSGIYTPPSGGSLDESAVIRATSTADTNIWAEVPINIDANGNPNTLSVSNTAMGRSEAVAFYDSTFDRVFYCGGYSEADGNKHDDVVGVHNLTNNSWSFVTRINPSLATNTIAWAHDTENKYLYAIVGNASSNVAIYRLNVSGSTISTWASVTATGTDIPVLSGNFRYLSMYDKQNKEIYICVGAASNSIYRLDVNNISNLQWRPKKTGVVGATGTPQTEKCAYFYDDDNNRHTLVGSVTSPTVATKVWYLNNTVTTWTWLEVATTGTGPTGGYDDGSASHDSNTAYLFGGKPGLGLFANDVFVLDTTSVPYNWLPSGIVSLGRKPPSRGRAALQIVGSDIYLYAGKNNIGILGDMWKLDTGSGTWDQPAPDGMLPQGRKYAAAVWVDTLGAGWVYGGLCDYGVSDEMWRLEFSTGKNAWEWFLEPPSALSTSVPPQLQGASLDYDPVNDRLLLFGGARASNGTLLNNEVFAYNHGTFNWSKPATIGGPPPGRQLHSHCYDDVNKRMIYFGGQDTGTPPFRNDVWMFNVQTNSWAQPVVTGSIDGRAGAFAGWNTNSNRMLVLGGYTQASGATLQLYELAFTSVTNATWTALATHQTTAPKAIVPGAGVYDADDERFLCAPPGQFDNQALVFCRTVATANPPPTWQNQTIGALTHGIGASGMYDPINGRFIAFGGENDLGGGKYRKLNQLRVLRLK